MHSLSLNFLGGAFTGKAWDDTSQLYYFPFRYYSPDAARWLTRDPLGMVDGPNVYAYVAGSPVRFADMLGLFRIPPALVSFVQFAKPILGWGFLVILIIQVGYMLTNCLNCVGKALEAKERIENNPHWDPCDATLQAAMNSADFVSECSGACGGLPKSVLNLVKKFVMSQV